MKQTILFIAIFAIAFSCGHECHPPNNQIYGNHNAIIKGRSNFIGGSYNYLEHSNNNGVHGSGNILKGSNANFVGGYQNVLAGSNNNQVHGAHNYL